jgi:hypothetical protein
MLLPETQTLVSNYKLATSLRETVAQSNERLRQLRDETNRLKREVEEHWDTIYRAEYNGYRGTRHGQRGRVQVKQTFPCPANDCRGFVNSDTGVCGVCDSKMCLQCGVIPGDPHACDEITKLNFLTIKKQTKPCPNCSVPTYKIDGCMQMFCTHCNTPWDWMSGSIIRGVIHNPHYFEWLRSQSEDGAIPRQPGDIPGGGQRPGEGGQIRCGEVTRIPSGYVLYQRIAADRRVYSSRATGSNTDAPDFQAIATPLTMFCRRIIHIDDVELGRLRRENDNADLRLRYLINDIDEDRLRLALQRREKKFNKSREIADVLDMVCNVGGDLLWAYVHEEQTLHEVYDSVVKIRQYVNRALIKVSQRYKMTVNQFYV